MVLVGGLREGSYVVMEVRDGVLVVRPFSVRRVRLGGRVSEILAEFRREEMELGAERLVLDTGVVVEYLDEEPPHGGWVVKVLSIWGMPGNWFCYSMNSTFFVSLNSLSPVRNFAPVFMARR